MSFVSAEIILGQPSQFSYNFGDEFKISVTTQGNEGQVEANIECGNQSKLVFSNYFKTSENKFEVTRPLVKSTIGTMKGSCSLVVSYNGEIKKSQDFMINNKILVEIRTGNLNYNAGESIKIDGDAKKENSKTVTGFVEISIGSNIKSTDLVKDGKFSTNLTLPEDIKSGAYSLKVRVYEKDKEGQVSNEGEAISNIVVKQEIRKIEISINEQSIKPGNDINFQVFLYDQANEKLGGDAMISVKDNLDTEILKKVVSTEEEITLPLPSNASSGYWKIEATSSGIISKRLFYIKEDEKVSFEIQNDTLIITNIGNVPYKKAIQIVIGNEVEIKEMDLEVGQRKEFRLLAPDGNYDISVSDGDNTLTESGVSLTGNVIGVVDLRQQLSVWNKYPIVWLFLIVVMGRFIVLTIQRTIKKRSYAFPVQERREKSDGNVIKSIGAVKEDMREVISEHSLVLNGQKQEVSFVCLRVKNKINQLAENNLEHAFAQAYEIKAVKYKTGEHLFLIFSPLLTRKTNNHIDTIKAALGIAHALKEHNKKFKDKIEFGIAVNSGEIVNKLEKNTLKFTNLGSFNKAKRIADISREEVLLGKEIHEKTAGVVKAEKQVKEGIEVFVVNKIADSERNKKFISDFLHKLEEEKKQKK